MVCVQISSSIPVSFHKTAFIPFANTLSYPRRQNPRLYTPKKYTKPAVFAAGFILSKSPLPQICTRKVFARLFPTGTPGNPRGTGNKQARIGAAAKPPSAQRTAVGFGNPKGRWGPGAKLRQSPMAAKRLLPGARASHLSNSIKPFSQCVRFSQPVSVI